jgi:hypothetical protein
MTEQRYISTLVGMHFRPPAKAVLEHLPAGAHFELIPEPENPYDEFAIKVLVSPEEVPESEHEALADDMVSYGCDITEFFEGGQFHLGYIGSKPTKAGPLPGITYAPTLQPLLIAAEDYKATLEFDAAGDPLVITLLLDSAADTADTLADSET